ncbi:MAG: sugar ABC transporter ATP-binding protein [bacterium]|nr:sugar ABC transporter ATP-binding protein [Candidatus Sumerlaeota bacterium]
MMTSSESIQTHGPAHTLLSMRGITKRFGGTLALDRAALEIRRAEAHALLGENGSGKSTLMKVLCGIHRADAGSITFNGRGAVYTSPLAAAHAGIAIVHQELNLVPVLSVAENLFLGREPRKGPGIADQADMRRQAERIFNELEISIDPRATVENLPVALCQMVEIARALLQRARLLILDEPTSALSDSEAAVLFRVVRRMRTEGASIIYISHKLAEIFALTDRYTVLRDGRTVTTGETAASTESDIVQSMVGRKLGDYYPPRGTSQQPPAREILRAENLVRPLKGKRRAVDNVSLSVNEREIVGIAGLVGAGRTELLETIFGAAGGNWSGRVILDGKEIRPASSSDAIHAGIALVTEDRARLGIFQRLTVRDNMCIVDLPRLSALGIVSDRKVNQAIANQSDYMRIRRASDLAAIESLSGGNQQKVVLARWLMTKPKLLLLDEPTRGIDVGAKAEIYRVLRMLANKGIGILFVSSELPEVLGLADRILVMSAGRITANLKAADATEPLIMRAAMSAE